MKLRNYLQNKGIKTIQFNLTNSGRQVVNLEEGEVTIFTKKDTKPDPDHYMVRIKKDANGEKIEGKVFVLTSTLPKLGDTVTL